MYISLNELVFLLADLSWTKISSPAGAYKSENQMKSKI